jgi:hypothetical protein
MVEAVRKAADREHEGLVAENRRLGQYLTSLASFIDRLRIAATCRTG